MERQKIFWVVLSVSVFVVVVLVAGAFLLRPRPATSTEAPVTVSPLSDQGTQVYEYQVPAGTPGASGGAGTTAAPGATGTPGTTGSTGSGGAAASSGQGGNTETLHFYIGEGQGSAGSTQSPSTTAPAAPAAPAGSTGAPSVQVPGLSSQVAAAPRAAASPRTAPATASSATPVVKPPVRSTQYWIQTGSYKSQTKAEDLAALLGDKGLAGRVFSYSVQGATWYRVRVGPYTSKGEAGKFLAEVRKLQGLETSFVSQVGPVRPPVN
jgi:DedD protein